MQDLESLKRLLETLVALKVTIRDTADTSVNHQLDEAIAELQQIIENNLASEAAFSRAMVLLGKLLSSLPSIAKLIELLSG